PTSKASPPRRSTRRRSRTPTSSCWPSRAARSPMSPRRFRATRRFSASRRASTPPPANDCRHACRDARSPSCPARTWPRRSRAAAVIASEDHDLAQRLQEAINSMIFRVYVNDDLVGVELCAAAKNVMALAAGGVDGLGLGDNAKASLITRGLVEMARLGEAEGAAPETFSGLAGMGDLIVTCFSGYGRNRRAGALTPRGATADQAMAPTGPGGA